jgi:hypothetical protein
MDPKPISKNADSFTIATSGTHFGSLANGNNSGQESAARQGIPLLPEAAAFSILRIYEGRIIVGPLIHRKYKKPFSL